ncbi:MAG TPA: helix-turn-helix domain-containing protein [Ferruginibacter sp.]|nr:helix-turn-helix domain-containing protein [Ferruginibacter sp.]HRO18210.1 helix-turn-helix domain-containing protein [Ferruginibacter sp.]HRQ20487.1 helix-turn-helix domain-containing protein [Ferruginibacter sp.]
MNIQMPDIRTMQCNIHPALRSLIRNIIIIKVDFGSAPTKMEANYMPSPYQGMFINLFTRFKSKKSGEKNFNTVTACTVTGAQITPFKLLVEESHSAVSIIFQPVGLNRFLNIPMTELFDNGYSARDVIGNEIEVLLDQSHDATTYNKMDTIIQSYFLKKLAVIKEPLPIDYALHHLLTNYNESLDKIAGMACMSIRNFERKCKERLGMPAKMYARIARFHEAYRVIESKPVFSWTDLTFELGYYDQTHFIKDFKEFAKLTPTLLHKELSDEQVRFQLDWDRM